MYECNECGEKFQNPGAVNMHKLWKHGKSQALSQEWIQKAHLSDLNEISQEKPGNLKDKEESMNLKIEDDVEKTHPNVCENCGTRYNDAGLKEAEGRCVQCGTEWDL